MELRSRVVMHRHANVVEEPITKTLERERWGDDYSHKSITPESLSFILRPK